MRSQHPRRRGLSLIEALISLAITASLLVAVGVAYQGASQAVTINDEFFRATQAARVTVNQIMAEVRKCQSGVVAPESLELTTEIGDTHTFTFDPDTGIMSKTIDGITPTTGVMTHNITSAQFDTDGETISLIVTVKIGNNQIILNGSAIPRRTIVYK